MKSPSPHQGLSFEFFMVLLSGTMADPDGKTLAKAVFVVVLFHCVKDN